MARSWWLRACRGITIRWCATPATTVPSEGLPYLDKVVLRTRRHRQSRTPSYKDLQAGDHHGGLDPVRGSEQGAGRTSASATIRSSAPPTSAGFEGLWFNFHNTVLASHPEVRQAMAIDD